MDEIKQLSLNYNKSKYMLITKKKLQILINFKITIGKHKIEQVSQIKYLGITFDDKLTWKLHIQQICSKLSSGSLAILKLGSGYFASRGKIAPCYFAIWRQNSLNGYFATSAKIALSLILTQTLLLIPILALTEVK